MELSAAGIAPLIEMKHARFFLTADQDLTKFKLRKEGEEWEQDFASIRQAMLFARLLPNSHGQPFIIHSSSGIELAHMTV